MIKPPALRPGDRIAAVSPSWGGPGAIPHRYQAGKRQIEETLGLQVVEMKYTLAEPEWLDVHPEARAADLMQAFADPSIHGIFTTIGGDDSIRLLPYLDLPVIQANPKVYLGFSDTTVTHLACYRAGLVSFYGPSVMTGLAENGGIFPYTTESIRRILFSPQAAGQIQPNLEGWTVERLDWKEPANQARRRSMQPNLPWRWLQGEGIHRGRLLGGNLEVLDWLRGTACWPPQDAWDQAIVFLETSEEAPEPLAVTRMLRSLAAVGVFERATALLFGRPGGDSLSPERFGEYDQAILRVVRNELGRNDLPVVTCMDFGHTDPVMILPYGILAEVDCQEQKFSLLESAVREG